MSSNTPENDQSEFQFELTGPSGKAHLLVIIPWFEGGSGLGLRAKELFWDQNGHPALEDAGNSAFR